MPALPAKFLPKFDATIDESARIISARFGDGYEQRSPDGINNLKTNYSLTFPGLYKADGDELEAFFRAQKGAFSIQWTPPNSTIPLNFVVRSWRRAYDSGDGMSTISATFERVYP